MKGEAISGSGELNLEIYKYMKGLRIKAILYQQL